MDHSTDSRTLCTSTTGGGSVLEAELETLSGDRRQTSFTEGTILLQLVEFKTHLVEVVEELHIRRDAETRLEDQISRLVLDKQELEWEKESLQRQTETAAKRHAESLVGVKKQFQAKIKSLEEEKGKYQVSVELKDREINNLKDELKSLQLLKYNLEKKTSELEQKLALQSRSKDSHLRQLGEVEKRSGVLSRQCAAVKRAHEKLEQNVDEALKRNETLTSAKAKLEATIVSLKKELEDANVGLIKAKMSSAVKDESRSSADRELRLQQLQQRLHTEAKVNEALMEENVSAREEKQEVMRRLEFTQRLLLSQTQAVSRVELELQMQKEQHQALKREHEVARDGSKAAQDKLAQLMESLAAARTSWAEEKAELLGGVEAAQRELDGVNRAHEELRSQAAAQARLLCELEKEANQGCQVCSNPPTSSSEALKPESLSESGAGASPAASGATGDGRVPQVQKQQQPETEQPSNSSDSPANSKNERDALAPPDSCRTNGACRVTDALSNSAAGHSSADDHDGAGRTEGRSGDTKEGEEDANWSGCDDGAETRGAQTADRADRPEDGQRSAGEPEDGEQTGGATEDRAAGAEGAGAEGARSHGVEERGKTEPLVPRAQIPTQTAAADTAAERGDAQQVVDLGDAGGGAGGGAGAEEGPTATPPAVPVSSDQSAGDSRTIGGDTEQAQPTSSPDVGGVTEQMEETDGGASAESAVERQVSPEAGEGTSEQQRQPAETPAAPHHHSHNSPTSEGGAARSDPGQRGATEFSASTEEDRAGSEKGNEAQKSQCSASSPLPATKRSDKTPLAGDKKPFSSSGGAHRLAFDWRSVQREAPSPRKSHVLGLHKCAVQEHRETASTSSVALPKSSLVYSRPPPTPSRLSRAPSSAALSSSDMEVSFSQEQGDQQSSLRAQISKIEHFLNAERLRSVKRPRTDS